MKSPRDSEHFFHNECANEIRHSIKEYLGQEIFWGALLDKNKKVEKLRWLGRGNEHMAPVDFDAATRFDVVIHNHPSSFLQPSDADLHVASALLQYGIGFYIVDNDCSQVNIVSPGSKNESYDEINNQECRNFFSENGALSQSLHKYEIRESQMTMLDHCVHAFNKQKILLCEASTGTGKSMAYLYPAILWAIKNREKIVISTNTINLQEQLISKDLPFLKRIMGENFQYQLVKGRNHFLCHRKKNEFEKELGEPKLLDELENNRQIIDEILSWSRSTKTGDRAELSRQPPNEIWDKLGSDADTCRPQTCPCADDCFYQNMRKRIYSADILVVNHHILCADLSIKSQLGRQSNQGLLPIYKRLIIDEAHNLEETAASYFGQSYTSLGAMRTVNLVFRKQKKKNTIRGGWADKIQAKMQALVKINDERYAPMFIQLDSLREWRKRFEPVVNEQYAILSNFLKIIDPGFHQEKRIRLTPQSYLNRDVQTQVLGPLSRLAEYFHEGIESIKIIFKKVEYYREQEKEDEDLEQLRFEGQSYLQRLESICSTLSILSEPSQKDSEVYWVQCTEKRKGLFQFQANISPVDVSESLRENLFEPLSTVILSSATLSDHRGFHFLREKLGLSNNFALRLEQVQVPYSFPYEKNCRGFIPKNMPPPNSPDYLNRLVHFLPLLFQYFRGRSLVLFTSSAQMHQVAKLVEPEIEELGLQLMVQGKSQRQEMLQTLLENSNTVLFGLASFWEGVDIRGENLSCLIMVKLPFSVPSEPLAQAKMEYIQKKGGNAFQDYSLPSAVMKFKQGFGRLIRSAEDKGLFVVLDQRLVGKPYGKAFINALPRFPWFTGDDPSETASQVYKNEN